MSLKKNTFSEKERLKSKKEISRIFKDGIFLFSENFSLAYLSLSNQETHTIAVSVPKKLFKSAVIRNKLKRRIKEAYRLNKQILYHSSKSTGIFFNFIILYKNKKVLSFRETETEITELLTKLANKS